MKFEKRLRVLEARHLHRGFQLPPSIVVDEAETVAEVLAREGVAPVANQWPSVIVDVIVPSRPLIGNPVKRK